MKFLKASVLFVITTFLSVVQMGCSRIEQPDYRDENYGYVQFKVYKEASYHNTKAVMPQLEYLGDATKVKVTLQYGEKMMVQTLVLSATNSEASEFGLRSEKLKLLTGKYQVLNFSLYDKVDQLVYEATPAEDEVFEVISDGLVVQDLLAKVVERGKARFTLKKDLTGFEKVNLKSANREYTFDEIKSVSITVKSHKSGRNIVLSHLKATFSIHFNEDDDIEDGYQTSTLVCDTLVALEAGKYDIVSYQTFDTNKNTLETKTVTQQTLFDVVDNQVSDVDVPVALHRTDAYINDYYALKAIWDALGGKDWYYVGENFNTGVNWNFNKDVDLWGDQPGVQLHSNGRVALIDLSNFGFYGEMPEALGQLTELVELYLGTHDDTNIYTYNPKSKIYSRDNSMTRMERGKKYLESTHPAVQFSEPIARAMAEKGVSIRATEMYKTLTEDQIIDKATGLMKIRPMDTNPGTIVNGLTKLPESIGNLKKLEKICIANSELAELPAGFAQMESCTDVELYNLPNMKNFPTVLAEMPNLIQANLSCNPQWGATSSTYTRHDGKAGNQADLGLHLLGTNDGKYQTYKTLQMIYMNQCGLSELTPNISNIKSLGLLSLSYNNIDKIYPFGSDIIMVQLYLDHNRLTEIPVDAKGEFCGMDDVENLSFSHNLLTELPDIFSAKSLYTMATVDFSSNKISKVQNGENYKGINVETFTLSDNAFTTYPVEFAKSKSKINYVNLRANSINTIPKEAFEGETIKHLVSLDLSYNDLTEIPSSFNAVNMPYFYGLELSYNEFSKFPYYPFDCAGLTVYGIRGQRNKAGERCLSEWPEGVFQHTGLRGLYLGSNNLGKIEDTISPLIYYLEISDNPNIIFDASDICYEYSIGAYFLIYDKSQDIRGCSYMR